MHVYINIHIYIYIHIHIGILLGFQWDIAHFLGCLLVDCLDFSLLGFYNTYNIGAKCFTFWRGPEDS